MKFCGERGGGFIFWKKVSIKLYRPLVSLSSYFSNYYQISVLIFHKQLFISPFLHRLVLPQDSLYLPHLSLLLSTPQTPPSGFMFNSSPPPFSKFFRHVRSTLKSPPRAVRNPFWPLFFGCEKNAHSRWCSFLLCTRGGVRRGGSSFPD